MRSLRSSRSSDMSSSEAFGPSGLGDADAIMTVGCTGLDAEPFAGDSRTISGRLMSR